MDLASGLRDAHWTNVDVEGDGQISAGQDYGTEHFVFVQFDQTEAGLHTTMGDEHVQVTIDGVVFPSPACVTALVGDVIGRVPRIY